MWVLVTDWNPLTIWFYRVPYIRFSATDYTDENIHNKFIHLCNNSIAKHMKKQNVSHHIDGNMWDVDQFTDWLQQNYGWDVFNDELQDKIKNIIIHSLECV